MGSSTSLDAGGISDSSSSLIVTALLLFFFFGLHNLLQEAIMSFEGFKFGLMLGYLEVLGVTVFTFVERRCFSGSNVVVGGSGGNVGGGGQPSVKSYLFLTFLLMSSSSLSNISLNYINYPTKVVFRSCKLLPTMLISTIVNKQTFNAAQYCAALGICLGLVLYAAADWTLAPSFRPVGLVLVLPSVVADSVLPNAQEKLFKEGATRSEVTFYTNVLVLGAMTFSTLMSGDLVSTLSYAMEDKRCASYLVLYTGVSYAAITTHMNSISKVRGGAVDVSLRTFLF